MTQLLTLLLVLLVPTASGAPSERTWNLPARSGLRGTPVGSRSTGIDPARFARATDAFGEAGSAVVVTAPKGLAGVSLQGWATWCAPTPTHCQGWGGDAHLGAVPGYGGTPYLATVRHGEALTVVRVVSDCACGSRHGVPTIIDLSPAAFEDLSPLAAGVIRVVVSRGASLPNTDTLEGTP